MNHEFLHAAASHSVRAVMRYLGTRLTGLSPDEIEAKREKLGAKVYVNDKEPGDWFAGGMTRQMIYHNDFGWKND